jgi:hypothetical protein
MSPEIKCVVCPKKGNNKEITGTKGGGADRKISRKGIRRNGEGRS